MTLQREENLLKAFIPSITIMDNETRKLAAEQGFIPVVPPKRNRKSPWNYDKELYKRRNEVERYFLRIKRFRRVFTRYGKLDLLYLGKLALAMIFDDIFMWTRSSSPIA